MFELGETYLDTADLATCGLAIAPLACFEGLSLELGRGL